MRLLKALLAGGPTEGVTDSDKSGEIAEGIGEVYDPTEEFK